MNIATRAPGGRAAAAAWKPAVSVLNDLTSRARHAGGVDLGRRAPAGQGQQPAGAELVGRVDHDPVAKGPGGGEGVVDDRPRGGQHHDLAEGHRLGRGARRRAGAELGRQRLEPGLVARVAEQDLVPGPREQPAGVPTDPAGTDDPDPHRATSPVVGGRLIA
jgi:hypothetical protein